MAPKSKRPKNFDELISPGTVGGYAYHVAPSGVVKIRGVGDIYLLAPCGVMSPVTLAL